MAQRALNFFIGLSPDPLSTSSRLFHARSTKRESNESSPARGRLKLVPPIRQFSPVQVKTGLFTSVRARSGGTCWRSGRMEVNGEQVDSTPLQVPQVVPVRHVETGSGCDGARKRKKKKDDHVDDEESGTIVVQWFLVFSYQID
jgi:hypothetical protein